MLSAFDLSVFPSLWEGTPLTVFEALAMGKPIVATDADGLIDVLTDGRDALIVPKRNARALADGIVQLIDDAAERAAPLAPPPAQTAQQYDIQTFVRQDGAALRAAAPGVAKNPSPRRARRGPVIPDQPSAGVMAKPER